MKISVCMATYNGAQHVKVQISSILKQLIATDQLIIVDDKSTDNTVEIIQNFEDPRIQLIINPINVGAAQTFNRALQEASGNIIFLSDQDDFWHDGKVTAIVRMFEKGNLDLLVHDAVVMRGGQVIHPSLFEIADSSPGVIKNIISNTFTGCCMVFRREVLLDVLPISGHIGLFHDAWIGVLAQYLGYKITFLPVTLIDFIRHESNASTLKRRSFIPIIFDRAAFVIALVLRIFRIYLKRIVSLLDMIA